MAFLSSRLREASGANRRSAISPRQRSAPERQEKGKNGNSEPSSLSRVVRTCRVTARRSDSLNRSTFVRRITIRGVCRARSRRREMSCSDTGWSTLMATRDAAARGSHSIVTCVLWRKALPRPGVSRKRVLGYLPREGRSTVTWTTFFRFSGFFSSVTKSGSSATRMTCSAPSVNRTRARSRSPKQRTVSTEVTGIAPTGRTSCPTIQFRKELFPALKRPSTATSMIPSCLRPCRHASICGSRLCRRYWSRISTSRSRSRSGFSSRVITLCATMPGNPFSFLPDPENENAPRDLPAGTVSLSPSKQRPGRVFSLHGQGSSARTGG